MDKKNLKFYVAPAVEVVEVELEGSLMQGSIDQPVFAPEVEDED